MYAIYKLAFFLYLLAYFYEPFIKDLSYQTFLAEKYSISSYSIQQCCNKNGLIKVKASVQL